MGAGSRSADNSFAVVRPYVSALVLFSLLRLAFFAYHYNLLKDSPSGAVAGAFLNGLMIDSCVAATALFAIRLLSFLVQAFSRPIARRVHAVLVYVCFGLFSFINLADIPHFELFDSRFNILLFDNTDQMLPVVNTAIKDSPFWWFILGWAVIVVAFVLLNRLLARLVSGAPGRRYPRLATVGALLVMALLSFLWIGEPFWRTGMFSVGNQALNQLSLNGVYTLAKAYDQKRILERDTGGVAYAFGSEEEAVESVRSRIICGNEEFVDDLSPLARRIAEPEMMKVARPNVVIILVEGFSSSYVGALGAGENACSPGFDRLAADGLLFTNFYGNETRTHHGLVSTVGSFPSLLKMVLTRRRGTDTFYTLGTLFRQYGYATSFLYGYDAGFDHMGFFLRQGGFDRIIDEDSFPAPSFTAEWGVSDEDLFAKAEELFSEYGDGTPFFSVLLTSSSHSPFEIPQEFMAEHPEYAEGKEKAAFLYADIALASFIESARSKSYFEKTIFVITGDHGEIRDESDRYFKRFATPLLIYAPALLDSAGRISTVGSQVDIAATLLHLVGYPHTFHFFGRNLLDADSAGGFAVMRNNFMLYYREGGVVLARDIRDTLSELYELDERGRMTAEMRFSDDTLKARLNNDLEAYLQSVWSVFAAGKHRCTLSGTD
jgi:phosphoglycerol transferase MdoB-like AlkP superfamily enzyme